MLTGNTSEQVIFIAIGSGANGKSTFFSILRSVLGDYAGSTPMNTLMQTKYGNENTYDLAAHEGKRLVIAMEGEAGSKLAEAKIKNDDRRGRHFLSSNLWQAPNLRSAI